MARFVLAALVLACAFSALVEGQQFCSFFGNKSPSPQPGLQNCTWYRDSSCCVNEEISALFSTVLIPANSNGNCRNYINYLMCYVCDPSQSTYYQQERLTVCADFCDDLLLACSDAVLQGDRLGARYNTNGTAYCLDRRFRVGGSGESCFTLAASKRTLRGSGTTAKPNLLLLCFLAVFGGLFGRPDGKTLVSVLVMSLVILMMAGTSQALVTDANIKGISQSVGTSIANIASNGILRSRLQQVYDTTGATSEMLNTTAILGRIDSKLSSLTNDLDFAASRLQTTVRTAHQVTAGRSSTATPSPGLSTLNSSYFIDADSREETDALSLMYNSTYRRYISFQRSVVKLPSDVDRTTGSLYDTIVWSAAIDQELRALQNRRNVRWTYFGSETGMYRTYPATAWPSNFAGFNLDFDPRTRPWYLAATSGPKAVGIFLDCSASMNSGSRWAIAKAAVTQVLNSLTRDDVVNIVCSKGSFIDANAISRTAAPTVLGCNKLAMMRATASNRAQLLEALNKQVPYGSGESHDTAVKQLINLYPTGTNTKRCSNILAFVTDGKDTESRQYRSVCYDHENHRSYGCNLIRTDFSPLYTAVQAAHTSSATRLRVIGIETGTEGSTLPGKLGCDNDGVFIQLESTNGVRSQMSPYFSYLARLANTANEIIKPTSPYVDVNGLGRIITLSRPIYDLSGGLLGVIGVDAVLDDLENTLLDDQFGLSYAFLIDREGRAIIHPRLQPSADLVDDPVYPHIRDLEVNNGQPTRFFQANGVLSSMLAQATGNSGTIVGPRPQQRGGLQDGVVWLNGISFTYYYSALTTSQYSYALVLTDQDQRQIMENVAYVGGQPQNYYHEITNYPAAVQTTIGYTTSNRQYNNIPIATTATTFKLAARAFCDPTRYLLSDVPNFTTVNTFFNSAGATPGCDMGGAVFVPEIRSTVWASQDFDAVWQNRTAVTTDEIVWTYFGSANGMWRSIPGSRSTRDYDPTRRPWYHRALANMPSLYASSAVYADAGGIGKVVTFAQSIFQRKSLSPTGAGCAGSTNRAGNCACTTHAQCESNYCYDATCANPQIAGVAAVDLRYNRFSGLVENAFATTAGVAVADQCSASNVRCMIVNDAAEVVYDTSIAGVADGDTRRYENLPLGFVEGNVMLNLLDTNVFSRFSFKRQGTCQTAPYAPRASDRDLILSADQQDNYYINRGPTPRFQNNFGCELDQIQFQRNTMTSLTNSLDVTYQGPCRNGRFRIFPVSGTNLLAVAIETTTNKSSNFFNFNCHIFNNIARSGGFQSQETACGTGEEGTIVMPTCPMALTYTPSCSFNGAPRLVAPVALLIATLVLLVAALRP